MFAGVWADNKDFDSVLISKRMLQDHMPDNVLDALCQVIIVPTRLSAVLDFPGVLTNKQPQLTTPSHLSLISQQKQIKAGLPQIKECRVARHPRSMLGSRQSAQSTSLEIINTRFVSSFPPQDGIELELYTIHAR